MHILNCNSFNFFEIKVNHTSSATEFTGRHINRDKEKERQRDIQRHKETETETDCRDKHK